MRTLIEKYASPVEETSDDGVVAIEYVVVAAAIVAALVGLWQTGVAAALSTRLQAIINSIGT